MHGDRLPPPTDLLSSHPARPISRFHERTKSREEKREPSGATWLYKKEHKRTKMDPQWPYQDPLMAGRSAQQQPFNNNNNTTTTNGLTSTPSKYAAQPPPPSQPPMGYTYEAFQTPSIPTRAPSMGSAARPTSLAPSPSTPSRSRDSYISDADTTMEDADPYNRAKYSVKTNHYARPSSQYFPTEESTAARRYSPKNALSPSAAPYNAHLNNSSTSPSKSHHSYAFPPGPTSNSSHHFNNHSNRSPTRVPNYTSPPQSYQSPPCEWTSCFFSFPFFLAFLGRFMSVHPPC